MKHSYYIGIFVILGLLIGCVPQEQPQERIEQPIEEETQEDITEEEPPIEQEKPGEDIIEEPLEEVQKEQTEEATTEEPPIEQEELEATEKEQIQQIFDYSKTKIKSYSYRYKGPSGLQYDIYVKGNKMRTGRVGNDNQIYLDREKKIAEEWCISHTKCGRQTGKIADLDYYDAYIETPIDWLAKITESKKIDEGFYYGKKGWKLDTNIGEVIIDSHYGFIISIKQEGKNYLFTDASFNNVKDSDVNIPEYLLST